MGSFLNILKWHNPVTTFFRIKAITAFISGVGPRNSINAGKMFEMSGLISKMMDSDETRALKVIAHKSGIHPISVV